MYSSSGEQRRSERVQRLAAEIYKAHRPRLLAIANRNSPTIEDAEEALHDSFAIFIDHFDPDSQAPPVAWLTLTLKRRCWACHRHQRRSREIATGAKAAADDAASIRLAVSTQPLPDEALDLVDTVAQMRGQLAALKPDERRALSLLALGYSYNEIAELNAWSYTKANRCVTEGRAELRRLECDATA